MFRNDPAPEMPAIVIAPACLAEPVAPDEVTPPPMPSEIVRPSGQPDARSYPDWLRYEHRRRERAELAGLHFQGERDAYRAAYDDTVAQMNECRAWAEPASRPNRQ